MITGPSEYYAVTASGYQRIPNIEVRGVDHSRQIPVYKTVNEYMNLNSHEKEKEVVPDTIQEEEGENEMFLPQYSTHSLKLAGRDEDRPARYLIPLDNKIMEKEEVSSIHLDETHHTPSHDFKASMHQSSISNINTITKKGILKRSLNEANIKNEINPKNKNNSQEDVPDDKTLYLQLEKERRARVKMQKSYRDLLSQLNKKQRYYASSEISEHDAHHKGKDSDSLYKGKDCDPLYKTKDIRKTMNAKFAQPEDEDEDFEEDQPKEMSDYMKELKEYQGNALTERDTCKKEAKKMKCVKKRSMSMNEDINDYKRADKQKEHENEQANEDEATERANQMYFQHQLEVQDKILLELETIKQKITGLEMTIYQRDERMERERIELEIRQKERVIQSMENENSRLKTINDVMAIRNSSESQQNAQTKGSSLNLFMGAILAILLMLLMREAICK